MGLVAVLYSNYTNILCGGIYNNEQWRAGGKGGGGGEKRFKLIYKAYIYLHANYRHEHLRQNWWYTIIIIIIIKVIINNSSGRLVTKFV